MDWRSRLTKKEKQHLRETGATTKDALIHNRMGQDRDGIRCFECEHIARKLGLEPLVNAKMARHLACNEHHQEGI